ncbi:unnamed protein product [Peniophora sp. CBMAI 1063]|nr:unnamed protein product [Peniophora sp. CBMAI 1063]
MPAFSFLWQSAVRVGSVKMAHRCQCVEAIQICRMLEGELSRNRNSTFIGVDYQQIERLACSAINQAVDADIDESAVSVQFPFQAFRDALTRYNLEFDGRQATERMEDARLRDDAATRRHSSLCEKLAKHSDHPRPFSPLVEFCIAPVEQEQRQASLREAVGLTFHVDKTTALPGLLFRFRRKYAGYRLNSKSKLPPVAYPDFYVESKLMNVNETLVRPVDSEELAQSIDSRAKLWVYGDCLEGHYELHRPMIGASGRVRSVSIAPTHGKSVRVFKDMRGQLASDRLLLDPDFSSPGIVQGGDRLKTAGRIYADEGPSGALIQMRPTNDMPIISNVHRRLDETSSPPFIPPVGSLHRSESISTKSSAVTTLPLLPRPIESPGMPPTPSQPMILNSLLPLNSTPAPTRAHALRDCDDRHPSLDVPLRSSERRAAAAARSSSSRRVLTQPMSLFSKASLQHANPTDEVKESYFTKPKGPGKVKDLIGLFEGLRGQANRRGAQERTEERHAISKTKSYIARR